MPRNDLIQVRRDTAANWAAVNPVLAAGEQGLATDTGAEKIGDGVTAWNALPMRQSGTYVPSARPSWAGLKAYDPARQLYNWKPSNTRKWRAALARAKDGTARATLNVYGDSIAWGQGATTARTDGWVGRLRTQLDALMPAGHGGSGVSWLWNTYRTSDPLFSFAGGLATELPGFGPFAVCGLQSNATAQYFNFGPVVCDTFVLHYIKQVSGAGFVWSVDGGNETFVSSSGAAGNVWATQSIAAGALGSHTLKIRPGATGFFYPVAVEALSGTGGIRVTSCSYPGKNSGDLASGADTATDSAHWQYGWNALPPDLSVIMFGANEYQGQWSAGQLQGYLTTLANRSLGYGDVLLVTSIPRDPNGPDPIKQSAYHAEAYAVADALDLPLLDIGDRWGTFVASGALYSDTPKRHPNGAGHRDIAAAVYSAITS